MVRRNAVPLGYGGIGNSYPQKKPTPGKLVESHSLEGKSGGRATENVIHRRSDLDARRGRGHRSEHNRGIFVVRLASPSAAKSVRLGEPRKLRDRIHRQLRPGVKLDIYLHEIPDSTKIQGDQLGIDSGRL